MRHNETFRDDRGARRCEERSDEAIQESPRG
jgi:hypothetical protein